MVSQKNPMREMGILNPCQMKKKKINILKKWLNSLIIYEKNEELLNISVKCLAIKYFS